MKTGKLLKYDKEQKNNISDVFVYTEINQGKFKVEENKKSSGIHRKLEPGTDTYRTGN